MVEPQCHKLSLEQIVPKKSIAYSPNLYEWMKKRAHFYADYADGAGTPHSVWRVKAGMGRDTFNEGSLFIGMPGDHGDFLGSRLMNALCEGGKASAWCYPGLLAHLEPVEGFWERYLQVGRCAVDPDHSIHYLDDRWHQNSADKRTCRWCGLVQNRRTFMQLVEGEEWAS